MESMKVRPAERRQQRLMRNESASDTLWEQVMRVAMKTRRQRDGDEYLTDRGYRKRYNTSRGDQTPATRGIVCPSFSFLTSTEHYYSYSDPKLRFIQARPRLRLSTAMRPLLTNTT